MTIVHTSAKTFYILEPYDDVKKMIDEVFDAKRLGERSSFVEFRQRHPRQSYGSIPVIIDVDDIRAVEYE